MTDRELAFLTIKIQTLLERGERDPLQVLIAVAEGFTAAANDRFVPGVGMVIPENQDAEKLQEIAARIRRVAARL